MKRILSVFSAAALVALSLVSCKKDTLNVTSAERADGRVALETKVMMNLPKTTRAAGDLVADTADERKVNRYDVFYFKHSDGSLDTQFSASSPTQSGENGAFTTGPVYVSNVALDIVVIANAPASLASGGTVTSLTALAAAVSNFSDNAADSFVMVGRVDNLDVPGISPDGEGVKHYTGTNNAGIVLERLANKVVLGNIKKNFTSPAMQSATVKLLGAWMVMVNKATAYTPGYDAGNDAVPTAADASYWNADTDAAEASTNSMITWVATSGSEPEITAAGLAANKTFYFYPNPAVESASASTQDFVTKLVIKIQVGAQEYFYPIGITQTAAAARNKIYEISQITLRRPGNDPGDHDINDYIDNAILDVAITVKDWVSADVIGSFNWDFLQ